MQTGALISGWGHLIVIGVAALSGPIFQDETENSISVSEISVVSLSEFDILQKKFSKDENYSNSLIDIKKEEDQLEKFDENTSNKDDAETIDKEQLASEIIKTSTPSIDSPELPEIVNSTPSGFETVVSVVGEEVALNLEVPEAKRLQSPDENFDIKIDVVYSTNLLRTNSTALPTANSKELKIRDYSPENLKKFSEYLLDLKQDALVVGHSDTTAVLAGLLAGLNLEAFENDVYDRIYQVVVYKDKSSLNIFHSMFECK